MEERAEGGHGPGWLSAALEAVIDIFNERSGEGSDVAATTGVTDTVVDTINEEDDTDTPAITAEPTEILGAPEDPMPIADTEEVSINVEPTKIQGAPEDPMPVENTDASLTAEEGGEPQDVDTPLPNNAADNASDSASSGLVDQLRAAAQDNPMAALALALIELFTGSQNPAENA